jgi:hypothetical protein
MDNDYGTWDAGGNDSWPAEYLIDAKGNVRYGSIGEGDYGRTEAAIRALLTSAGTTRLPPTTAVPDRTPVQVATPETYLGYQRLERYVGTPIMRNHPHTYTYTASLPADHVSYAGTWTVGPEDILAGPGAALRINVTASEIYLVLAGSGTVTASLNGKALATQHVSGVPTLYTLLSAPRSQHGVLQLSFSSGIKAYDFTFG